MRNFKKWQDIQVGDIVLFAWDGALRGRAIVSGTFESESLSRFLRNENSYKNIYLLGDIENIDIPYSRLNKTLNYAENYIIQSFQVLSEDQTSSVLEDLDLGQTTYAVNYSKTDYEDAVIKLSKERSLDKETAACNA